MSSTQSSQKFVGAVRERVGLVVVGQDVVVERVMIALLTGGHLLLQGMPGLAKTLLVNTVAKAIHLDFKRIQFTVDMLPSDILGSEVVDQKTGEFRIHRGPVFTNLLLADEINRAAPKVQGAMLEAMQERKVTLGGQSLKLPTPFLVIATQNPVEQSGTFELPEAQLDRFMLLHRLGYPGRDEEQDILRRQLGMGLRKEEGGAVPKTAFDMIDGAPVGTAADLVAAMESVQQVHVSEVFLKHSVELVRRTRESQLLDFGCSPRAGVGRLNPPPAPAVNPCPH
jgi:MoxR-like ATPase